MDDEASLAPFYDPKRQRVKRCGATACDLRYGHPPFDSVAVLMAETTTTTCPPVLPWFAGGCPCVFVAFGLFSQATAVVIVVTAIAVLWMLAFFYRSGGRHPVLPVALGLVIGGSCSNLFVASLPTVTT